MITEEKISSVRKEIRGLLSDKRFSHTLGVEREALRLSEIYIPEKAVKMRAAALLHDITKELKVSDHLDICDKFNIELPDECLRSPKLLHSLTGAYLAREKFADTVDDEIFYAIKYHTLGREDMSITEKIIYLADYIEDTRTFGDCIRLRRFFYDGLENASTCEDRQILLDKTLVLSFDMTLNVLMSENAEISVETVKARNYIVRNLKV